MNKHNINVRHGFARKKKSPEWKAWEGMRSRCYYIKNPSFYNYGGRNIKVCARWHIFENFIADMGLRPTPRHSLDRIDTNGDYSPENCRWATPREQQRNTRKNRLIEYNGHQACLAEWSEISGIGPRTIAERLKRGWPVHKALTYPMRINQYA